MAQILQDLLLPSFVRDVVTRVLGPSQFLSESFNFGIGGSGVKTVPTPGRTYTYDIFDNVAKPANARASNAPAGTVAVNPVGNNTVTLGRFSEKINLDYNQLLQIRKLGEGAGVPDKNGAAYIERQARVLRTRQEIVREVITGAMFNGGKYGYWVSGDDWVPTYNTSPTFQVDMKIDTGNILTGGSFAAGLQMGTGSNIVTATWATDTTDIPLQLDGISSAFEDLVGAPLKRIYCGTDVWNNVLNNTKVRQVAGTSNVPAQFERIEVKNDRKGITTHIVNRLVARPWIEWYVSDHSIEIATSGATTFARTKVLPRNYCTFMIDPTIAVGDGGSTWMQMIEGSMIIKDNDWSPPVDRQGFYAWAKEKSDPATVEYHTNQIVGMELSVPKAIAWARVQ